MAFQQLRKSVISNLSNQMTCQKALKSTASWADTSAVTSRQASSMAQEVEVEPVQEPMKMPLRNKYDRDSCQLRRQWVEQVTGVNMFNSASWWPDENKDTTMLKGNIENAIGLAKVPLAVAGPLTFHGAHAEGEILAPIATTEGALVAATCRGAKAINMCGGVKTWATHQRMSRAPMFTCANPAQAVLLGDWIMENKKRIQEEVISKYSRHANLKEVICVYDRRSVHAAMRYETGDAAGQNQTTTVTSHALKWIVENAEKEFTKSQLDIQMYVIDNNFSGDKKPNGFNAMMGRGLSAMAEAELSEQVLQQICGIDSETFVALTESGQRISSRMHHHSFNANVANILAGVFTATGQDIGCVGESGVAAFSITKRHNHPEGGVHISTYMPCLVIGTVGGGTALPTQKECLEMMGCHGSGKVQKFAEIIAGYCLALDLATWSAVTGGYFAESHERLGRNRPEDDTKR